MKKVSVLVFVTIISSCLFCKILAEDTEQGLGKTELSTFLLTFSNGLKLCYFFAQKRIYKMLTM